MATASDTGFNYGLPFGTRLSLIENAGFKVVALDSRCYTSAEARKEVVKLLGQKKLSLDSVHAPFPGGDNLFSLEEEKRQDSLGQCQLAIDVAAETDGKIVVVHLIPYNIPEGEVKQKMVAQGRKSLALLSGYALRKNIKLALENGQKLDYDHVLEEFLTEFGETVVGFCYDSGHEHVQGRCFHVLVKWASRLLTMHLHDNLGTDTHLLPGEGNIDWRLFQKTIQAINYQGNLLLEVSQGYSRFKDPEEFLKEARERADRLTLSGAA